MFNVHTNILEPYLTTTDNQFGFKKQHSTDMCIFSSKSVIKYYNYFSSPVYSCFLDASKAFDKINHWILFTKMIKRSIPSVIVRIILFWYQTQTACIKWGQHTSSFFTISNGTRQGSVLSPRLFSMYVDDLSHLLADSKVGCFRFVFLHHYLLVFKNY